MDAKSSSPADPRQTREFCFRNLNGKMVAPARYDGSACVVMTDHRGIYALAHQNLLMNWNDSANDINGWLIEKGYTPIW
jgi:hypothetical protein